MKKEIVEFIKYNKIFLAIYRLFAGGLIVFLKLFIRVKKKKVLFMSFGGKKYDDSPKALYETIKNDDFFKDYKFVWAFYEPEKYNVVDCKKVKVDSLRYYFEALSAGVWVTNSSMERGLKLKREKQIEFNTWHGTPLKKMGEDIHNKAYTAKSRKKIGKTIYCSQSEYDKEIFTKLFSTNADNVIISDLPRNDSLLNYSKEKILALKKELSIPLEKKVILYAPTFREYERDSFNACYLAPPIDLLKWEACLGEEYVLLFRAHYEIVNVLGVKDNSFVKNVSSYHCLNDLIAVSDLLISDYSSIYFDYAITGKPMLNFSYDLDVYKEKRGLYLDLGQELKCAINTNEDTLLGEIQNLEWDKCSENTKHFAEKFAPKAGHACELVIEKMKQVL